MRTAEQRVAALETSHRHKRERLEVKERIGSLADGEARVALARLVEDPPLCCRTARVERVLGWVESWGSKRIHSILSSIPPRTVEAGFLVTVVPTDRICDLTPRQRSALVEAIHEGPVYPSGWAA